VLANRLHRMALKATRWAAARVQGMAADIGGQNWSCCRREFSFRKFETAYVSSRSFRIAVLIDLAFTTTVYTNTLARLVLIVVRIQILCSTWLYIRRDRTTPTVTGVNVACTSVLLA
jgi:hypothetical protein